MWNHLYNRFGKYPHQHAKTIWKWIASSPINPDTELGYLSHLLNGILLIIILLGTIAETAFLSFLRMFNFIDTLSFGTILLLTFIYMINRRGNFKMAITLTLSILVLALYAIFWFGNGDAYSNKVLDLLHKCAIIGT